MKKEFDYNNGNSDENKTTENRNREFVRMQEEYREITPPENGLEQLEETIQKAKIQKHRRKKLMIFRNAGLGMAAAFAAVFLLANTNENVAYAMEKVPVLGNVIRVITGEHFEAEERQYTADIKTPKLESEKSTSGIEKVNEEVKKEKKALIEECRKVFESDAAQNSKEPGTEGLTGHYHIDADYEILADTEDYFVLRFWSVTTSASAQQVDRYYTLDRKTGELLQLKDLFQEGADYVTPISENIKEQMKEQMAADENVYYWLDDKEIPEWNFKEIKKDQSFYIDKEGNLVIAFEEYEVAPGYMGTVSFKIPKDTVADILK